MLGRLSCQLFVGAQAHAIATTLTAQWTRDGTPASSECVALPSDLASRLSAWNATYEHAKLPIDGTGDTAWLAEGRLLRESVRSAFGPHVTASRRALLGRAVQTLAANRTL